MHPDNNPLTLEQEFEMKVFAETVQQLSREEAHALLVELRQNMMLRENSYKEILKNALGIGQGFGAFLEGA